MPIAPSRVDASPVKQRVSKIWIIRTGAFDALALLAPTLALIRAEAPGAALRVLISRENAATAPSLVGGIDWIATSLDPAQPENRADPEELARIERMLRDDAPDVLACAGPDADWLALRLAGCCPRSLRVAVRCREMSAYPVTTRCDAGDGGWREGQALAALILGKPLRPRPVEISTGAEDELVAVRRELEETRRKLEETVGERGRTTSEAEGWTRRLAQADEEIARLKAEFGAKSAETDLLRLRIEEREASLRNMASGHVALELHKHYQRIIRQKEAAILALDRVCREREALIGRLTLEATRGGALSRRIGLAAAGFWSAKVAAPLRRLWENFLLEGTRRSPLGEPRQHPARRAAWDRRLAPRRISASRLPRIGLVTPSLNQARHLERAIASATRLQAYPKLFYVIQDGGSSDRSVQVIRAAESQLHGWLTGANAGKGDALARGFDSLAGALAPDDVMAWLDGDDVLAPGALRRVGDYFARHPRVDVVYGHRILIDEDDREIGRWVMPRHDAEMWRWVDWVPRETLFWRKRAWDRAGGIDPSLHYTLAWDLLLRFEATGARIVRLPRFLGAKRVGDDTPAPAVQARRDRETRALLDRVHGASFDENRQRYAARRAAVRSAWCEALLRLGIRW